MLTICLWLFFAVNVLLFDAQPLFSPVKIARWACDVHFSVRYVFSQTISVTIHFLETFGLDVIYVHVLYIETST